jgi:hypothetical protein
MSYSAEHMRKSRLTFVEWKNDDGSLADLFQSCKKFRTSVHEHGMSHQLDKVEREIEKLESFVGGLQFQLMTGLRSHENGISYLTDEVEREMDAVESLLCHFLVISNKMDKIEHEIVRLENLMRLCAHIKDLKDLMRLLP